MGLVAGVARWCVSGVGFGEGHPAELTAPADVHEEEQNHKDAVEAKRQGVEEHGVAVLVESELCGDIREKADFVGNPGADDGQAGYGCAGGIDEEGELFAADAESVGDGLGEGADDNGVGVVIDEAEDAETSGGRLCGFRSFDALEQPGNKAGETPCGLYDRDHNEHRGQKGKNLKMGGVGKCAQGIVAGGLQSRQPGGRACEGVGNL